MKSRGIIRLCQHSPHPSPISGISSGCKPFFPHISPALDLKGIRQRTSTQHAQTHPTSPEYLYFLHLQTTEALLIDAVEEHKSNNEHTE